MPCVVAMHQTSAPQVREVQVAQFKLEHRGWAMKRERAPQLRAAITHAWRLHQAGKPNDYVRSLPAG